MTLNCNLKKKKKEKLGLEDNWRKDSKVTYLKTIRGRSQIWHLQEKKRENN